MNIIVADANIFVYLFECGLLDKFVLNGYYQIKITQEVYSEITDKNRRISRDYPNLRERLNNIVHNSQQAEHLAIVDLLNDQNVSNNAKLIYYTLVDQGELDNGEIESIPLAFDMNARFVSHDGEAITVANSIKEGLGILFIHFCKELLQNHIISDIEFGELQDYVKRY